MKKLNLNKMGVTELTQKEKVNTQGGVLCLLLGVSMVWCVMLMCKGDTRENHKSYSGGASGEW